MNGSPWALSPGTDDAQAARVSAGEGKDNGALGEGGGRRQSQMDCCAESSLECELSGRSWMELISFGTKPGSKWQAE